MSEDTPHRDADSPERESYAKVLGNLGGVLAALALIAALIANERPGPARPKAKPAPPRAVPTVAARKVPTSRPTKKTVAEPAPPPPAPELDREAVARGEADLDAASRDRERAEARAEAAARRLSAASVAAAAEARAAKSLAFRIRDPSTRATQALARGGFLRGERDQLRKEIATLASLPRPKARVLSNKNPVARAADGEEYHFELRRNRITFVDLDKLLGMVKADALLRIRMSEGMRTIESRVGPEGPFSLEYSLSRSFGNSLDDLMDRRRVSFDLRGWEIVPEFENRGETYEAASRPVSAFARAINRLNPATATVTMWVYPDSFPLFRRLRDDLQARGFLVAGRPLPEGMAIRGSPSGSLSAGQ